MTERTFHQRFTLASKCGIMVFSGLAFWFFWERQAFVGLLVMIIVIGMIERVLHTEYTFKKVKPVDREEEHWFLIINRGRFSRRVTIPVEEIKSIREMPTPMKMSHFLLITYGPGNVFGVQPVDEDAFLATWRKTAADPSVNNMKSASKENKTDNTEE